MTKETYLQHAYSKSCFKVVKKDKIRYVLAYSLEHCASKFLTWSVFPVSREEFESNYHFDEIR